MDAVALNGPTLEEIQSWPATVSVDDACAVFGISRSHGYKLINAGEFPAKVITTGGRRCVVTASIVAAVQPSPFPEQGLEPSQIGDADDAVEHRDGIDMTRPVSDRVGDRLFQLRKAARMTREELAERCQQLGANDLTANGLCNIETGRRDGDGHRRRWVRADELVAFAAAFNVPMEFFTAADESYADEVERIARSAVSDDPAPGQQPPSLLGTMKDLVTEMRALTAAVRADGTAGPLLVPFYPDRAAEHAHQSFAEILAERQGSPVGASEGPQNTGNGSGDTGL